MKFAVFGAGGVGGYFGGKLAQAGQDVTFIARGEHLKAIRQNGLRVESVSGDFGIHPAKATDNPAEVGAVDVVLLSTKAWNVPDVIEQMKPLMGENTYSIWLGNGITPTEQLEKAFGRQHVLGGFCRISSFIAGPGHIQHVGVPPYIAFGELDNSRSQRAEKLREIFARIPEIKVEIPSDIQVGIWEKFIYVAAVSGVGAVTRQPNGVFRSVPETRTMLILCMEEILKIGQARGVNLSDDLVQKMVGSSIDKGPADVIASMHKAIMEGKPSELDDQTGAVIRMGRRLGIPTPTNDFVYAALLPMELKARGRI
jgi:2-dehydropantoate 2-reductase